MHDRHPYYEARLRAAQRVLDQVERLRSIMAGETPYNSHNQYAAWAGEMMVYAEHLAQDVMNDIADGRPF